MTEDTKTLERITTKNLISLGLSYHDPKKDLDVHYIDEGLVIDHLEPRQAFDVWKELNMKGIILGIEFESPRKGEKDFIKIRGTTSTPRLEKIVATVSPGARINTIKKYKVVKKTEPIICEDKDCVTRDLDQNISPRFYAEDGKLYCETCDHEYTRRTEKVEKYISMLESNKKLSKIMGEITTKIFSALTDHVLTLDSYSLKREKGFDEKEKAYIKVLGELENNIQRYILDSFFYIGDGDGRFSEDTLRESVHQRLSNIGLAVNGKYAASRLISKAVEYGKDNFLERVGGNYVLKKEPDKKALIERYMESRNEESPLFLFSNMLKAIDNIAEVQK